MTYSSAARLSSAHASYEVRMAASAAGSHAPRSIVANPTRSRMPVGESTAPTSSSTSIADEWSPTGRPQHSRGSARADRTTQHTGHPHATRSDTIGMVQPWLPGVEPGDRIRRARGYRPAPATATGVDQLVMFPPSIMRRTVLRRRRCFAWMSLDGARVRWVTESVPCELPTSADDRGLPDVGRWTPPRHSRDFDRLPYAEDFAARLFVRDHPEGATLQQIADEIGWTKQGVNEVLLRATRKLVALARVDRIARRWMADVLDVDIEEIERLLCRN